MLLGAIGSLVFAVVFATMPAFARADFSQISGNTTLKVGSKGADVTSLQQFMASGQDIYPSGLTTGYFGSLSKAAAIQLQLAYDLTPDGIVGRNTINKINNVIGVGQGMDISAPIIYNFSASPSARSLYINFTSNEPVKTTVFYDTNPISWTDSTMAYGVPMISGATSIDNSFSSSKQITLSNLSANSNYYYVVMTTDSSGNISVTSPRTVYIGQ